MNDDPRIGKDVIESLTLGMYEDCRFIYREYIQNSADQVDKAIAEELMAPGEDEKYTLLLIQKVVVLLLKIMRQESHKRK